MQGVDGVDGPASPRAVMLSIPQIAERDGVSKQAVSRKVKQLVEDHGLAVERDNQGRVALINAAQYDFLRNRYADPSKAQAPRAGAPAEEAAAVGESYDEALRQKTWITTEQERLKLGEMRGALVKKAELVEAVTRCGAEIAQIERRDIASADDLALIALREGANGIRRALKAAADRRCAEIADALAQIATLSIVPGDESSPVEAAVET